MSMIKVYSDIPGTTVFDGSKVKEGYHLNQLCMSLMKASNRQRFLADEASYLEDFEISLAQREAILNRDYGRMIELGGNIYFLVKLTATDGKSVLHAVSTMTNLSETQYAEMMANGGRSIDGNRYEGEMNNG